MKVRELAERLRAFDPEAEVLATWEGITVPLTTGSVFAGEPGVVLINAENWHEPVSPS